MKRDEDESRKEIIDYLKGCNLEQSDWEVSGDLKLQRCRVGGTFAEHWQGWTTETIIYVEKETVDWNGKLFPFFEKECE